MMKSLKNNRILHLSLTGDERPADDVTMTADDARGKTPAQYDAYDAPRRFSRWRATLKYRKNDDHDYVEWECVGKYDRWVIGVFYGRQKTMLDIFS